MQALMIGVAADTKNIGNCSPIFSDSTFEYIPIDEKHDTIERKKYNNTKCGFSNNKLSYFIKNKNMHNKRLHFDPEFIDFTYGDPTPQKRKFLRELQRGDLVIFYAGLSRRGEIEHIKKHRYIIGYFILRDDPYDFNKIIMKELSKNNNKIDPNHPKNFDILNYKKNINGNTNIQKTIRSLKNNAHIKRYYYKKDVSHLKDLVIIKGNRRSKLLSHAIPISDYNKSHYFIKSEIAKYFGIANNNRMIDIKRPIWLKIDAFKNIHEFRGYLDELHVSNKKGYIYTLNSLDSNFIQTGSAPNDYGNILTIGTCKPMIREWIKKYFGEGRELYIFGITKKFEKSELHRLVFFMRVSDVITFEDANKLSSKDNRFSKKRAGFHGDIHVKFSNGNYYYLKGGPHENGRWIEDLMSPKVIKTEIFKKSDDLGLPQEICDRDAYIIGDRHSKWFGEKGPEMTIDLINIYSDNIKTYTEKSPLGGTRKNGKLVSISNGQRVIKGKQIDNLLNRINVNKRINHEMAYEFKI